MYGYSNKDKNIADTQLLQPYQLVGFSYDSFKTAEKVILEHSNLLGVDREGKGVGGGVYICAVVQPDHFKFASYRPVV